ncbi:MAG: hypothetical protein GX591_08825 [Planctomycetes bacterium]|nr:hypothetical protein [Planctomycetota bacterium]
MTIPSRALAVLALILAAAGAAVAAETGPRYTDELRGFSLCPPAGATVVRRTGTAELVQFVLGAETGRTPVELSVQLNVQTGDPVTDLAAFSLHLADHLLVTQNFQVDPASMTPTTLAGHGALILEGSVGGSVFGLFRRDVWVRLDDHRFLVLRASGPLDRADEVRAAGETAAATLWLFDPAATRAKLEQDLARGGALLEGLDGDALRAALTPGDHWYAVVRSGKVAGFVHVSEQWARQDRVEGLRVVTESAMAGEGAVRKLARDEAFCSFDLTFERWESFSIVLDGDAEQSRHLTYGIRQHGLLLIQTVVGPRQTQANQVKVPVGIYLPRALASVAPALLDRRQPGGYAFARYDDATGGIEMRTLTVVGPSAVTLGGQTFEAVELIDQASLGAPQVKMAVDGAGRILSITRPDGALLQRTTEQAIRARFAEELDMLAPVDGGAPAQ